MSRKPLPSEKQCARCKEVKPIAHFSIFKKKRMTKTMGLRVYTWPYSYCKPCEVKRVRDWQKDNRNNYCNTCHMKVEDMEQHQKMHTSSKWRTNDEVFGRKPFAETL